MIMKKYKIRVFINAKIAGVEEFEISAGSKKQAEEVAKKKSVGQLMDLRGYDTWYDITDHQTEIAEIEELTNQPKE